MHDWAKSLFAGLAGLILVLPAVLGAQAATGSVMMVLDASGSMWGRIDGTPKIVIAREAIGDLLQEWDPGLELGLIAYGHRRKGDCSDIETLIPLSRDTPGAVVKAVGTLQPKGQTPLSAAVRRAAAELKYTEKKATVILVSDGRETCDVDPCAAGTDLEKLGFDFTAHVIGFDVTNEDETGLQCLTGHGANIDTTTASGKLVFGIFAALAEFERELIRERTMAGLASARARGRRGGRPLALTKAQVRLAQAAIGKRETRVRELCEELGVTKATLYRYVGPGGSLRERGQRALGTQP